MAHYLSLIKRLLPRKQEGWSLKCLQMCNVFYQWRSINCSRGSSIRCGRSEWSYPTRRTRMSNHQRHNYEVQVQGEIWIGFSICAFYYLQTVFYATNLPCIRRISLNYPRICIHFVSKMRLFIQGFGIWQCIEIKKINLTVLILFLS